ncbi:MAG TPA: ATP-binding protein [Actinomycetota bacterium]|nr:ATP-binding protein [Actinomycetota bacterium]
MDSSRLIDLHRSQRTMIIVRWIAVPWAIFQFVVYENPYPPGYVALGWSLIVLLIVGNAAIHLANRGPAGVSRARTIAAAGIALDIAVISGIVWLYTFDQESALWALLFILPLEGANSFQLPGALLAWGASTLIYIARELYGSRTFGYALEMNSITYRMGIALIIALVAGFMARDLVRQRSLLGEALSELQRVDQLRSGLISTLGHDVRNPLTVIRGSIETLMRHRARMSEDDVERMLEGADRHARRLETLATDLLDLARLEAGRLELRLSKMSVEAAVTNALSYLETASDFDVRVQEGLNVQADAERVEQILHNLASNAVRHGEPPFVVEAAQRNGSIVIDVVDHGPGVSPDTLAQLFEPFGTESATGSVGYGLAIVKALVEAHGGTVAYLPNEPRGARFSVVLPNDPTVAVLRQELARDVQ